MSLYSQSSTITKYGRRKVIEGGSMKRIIFLLVLVAILAGVAAFTPTRSRYTTAQDGVPIFVKEIPAVYIDWKVVSGAHAAGEHNVIRAVLGNVIAIKAYR